MTTGEPGSGDRADFEGFVEEAFEGRRVWRGGSGPAIIVIHEMPGLHPGVVDFARRLVAVGFTAYLPSLFGTPGRPFGEGMVGQLARACASREFSTFALGGPARSSGTCAGSPRTPTRSVAGRAWARSGCA